MKIATFNVNSIRKRLSIVLEWLQKNEPDVLCLQETKVSDAEFPLLALQSSGYHIVFRGMKGYNGVATLTKKPVDKVIYGLEEGPDSEDFRIIQTVYEGIPIINTYVPNGSRVGSDKFDYKLKWFRRLREYFELHLKTTKPAIWLGDLNIAPEPMDVYDPKGCVNDPCFHIDARNAYKETVSWGFIDVFRKLYPDRVQYTFWDFFRNHFSNNRGWRLDHILATKPLADCCKKFEVDVGPRQALEASDHTIVWAEFSTD
jgi:exodeoxyribonuclease-3